MNQNLCVKSFENETTSNRSWTFLKKTGVVAMAFLVTCLFGYNANAQVSHSENFDSGSGGYTGSSFSTSSSSVCSGSAMRANLYSGNTSGNLTSPNIGTADGTTVQTLAFDYKIANWSGNTIGTPVTFGSFTIQYGATATGPWTTIATIDASNHIVSGSCAPLSYTFTPPAGALFLNIDAVWNAGDYYINIDNIDVSFAASSAPSCATNLMPADLATGIVMNPTLTWDAEPSATSYDVYLSTTTPATLVGNVPTNSYTPSTNLSANTLYYYNIVPVNAIGAATGCTEQSFTTGAGFNYCAATYSSGGSNDGITNVTLGALNNTTSGNSSSPYYTFFNMATIPDLGQTTNADVSITFGSDGNQYSAVWIDFNQDGIFDASEGMIASGNAGSGGTIVISIPVPAGAVMGNTRMRVRGGNDSPLTTAQACGASSSNWGETEDYIVNIVAPPACGATSGLTSMVSSGTSAQINWDMVAMAGSYNWEIRTSGAAGSGATGLVASANTMDTFAVVTTLSPQTSYSYYAQADCSGPLGLWSSTGTFTTPCAAVLAPWSYDVEAESSTTSSTLDPTSCWSTSPSGNSGVFRWNVTGNGSTPSSGTGASSANSGSKFFFTEASSGSSGAVAELYTPFIDVSALTSTGLEFYTHMYGSNITALNIDVFDGTAWTNDVAVITGQQQSSQADPFSYNIFDLGAYTGSIQIRFRVLRGTSYEGDVCIDDINVMEMPSCVLPSALTVSSVTDNSVTLDWTENGSATAWNIIYGAPGFDPATAGTSVPTTTNPATVLGLTCETSYDFYVQADCGSTDGVSLVSSATTGMTDLCPCTGMPVPGNSEASLAAVCTGSDVNLSLQNAVSGAGVTYQWESADDMAFTVNVQTLGTASTETATVSGDTYYRCLVSCASSLMSDYSNPVLVMATPLAPGNDMASAISIPVATNCLDSAYIDTVNTATDCYTDEIGNASADVFYTFTLTSSSPVSIGTCSSDFDTYLRLLDVTGATIENDDDDCIGTTSLIDITLAAGTYFVAVEGFSSNEGEVVLSVSNGIACNACDYGVSIDSVSVTSNSGLVHFATSPFPGTGWYIFEYKESSSSTWLFGGSISGSSTQKLFPGLNPSTSYDVRMQVKCDAFTLGPWSPAVTFMTPALSGCALSPTISASTVTGGSVTLTWPAVASAGWYSFRYKESSSSTWLSGGSAGGSVTTKSYTGLTAGTSYDFEARTTCTNGIPSAWGSPINVMTTALAGCELPPVLDVAAMATTTSSITISWTAVTGIGWYTFEYKESSSSTWINGGSAGPSATSKTFVGLMPGISYDFRAQSKCPNGAASGYGTPATYLTGGGSTAIVVVNTTDKATDLESKALNNSNHATKVYPNPTTNRVNIELFLDNDSDAVSLRLMDMSGRVVRVIETQAVQGVNTIAMDLQDLSIGMYTLLVYDNNNLLNTTKVKKD